MKRYIDKAFMPSIFDKLTDKEPRKRKEINKNKYSIDEYREIVVRDIISLLNTSALTLPIKFSDQDEVSKSTVFYGIPALSGVNIDDVDWSTVQNSIKESIQNFEPRLIASSVIVEVLLSTEDKFYKKGAMFEISGSLKIEASNNYIYLKTLMDTDSCTFKIMDTKT